MSTGRTLEATLASKRVNKIKPEEAAPASPIVSGVGWIGRIACLAAVVLFAWLRGGVSFTSHSWLGWLLVVGLVAWWIELLLERGKSLRGLPVVALPVLLGISLGIVQLIPLSDSLARSLAPRQQELLEALASPAGMVDAPPTPTTHISLDVNSGWNQLALLCFGLAALFLGAHFFKTGPHLLWFFLIVALNAAAVALMGLLQRVSIGGDTLLPNDPVSGVLPFGTFVNRNNAAGYLLMGLAAAAGLLYWNLTSEPTSRRPKPIISKEIPVWRQIQQRIGNFLAEMTPARAGCLLLVAIIVLGLVGTLSRGGVLALLVGGLLTTMTYGIVRDSESRIGWAAFTLIGVVGLSLWMGFGSQLAQRFDELNKQQAVTASNRMRNWADTLPAVSDFGPWGSGLGSYHAVHRLYRQDLEERLFENADNQYFQTLVEAGWVGLAALLIAIAIMFWSVFYISNKGNSNRSLAIGVAGMFLIASISVASFLDYGLLMPANGALMAMFVGLVAAHTHGLASRSKKHHWLRYDLPKPFTGVVALAMVASLPLFALHFHRLGRMERLGARSLLREDYLSLPADACDRQIAQLEPLVAAQPTFWAQRRLGELYIHRYRLDRMQQVENQAVESPANSWILTNLVSMHEQMCQLKRIGDRRMIEAVAASPAAQQYIVPAWRHLIESRNLLPFQTDVQLMLGQIQSVFGEESLSQICLERAVRTAPSNADYAYIIGLLHLQADRLDQACSHWNRCISLQPDPYFSRVMDRIHLQPSDRWRIEPETVLEKIIPPDPYLLFAFCTQNLNNERYAALRQECLQKADELLERNTMNSDAKAVGLAIGIKLGLGQKEEALEKMKWLLRLAPRNVRLEDVRFDMAKLMFDLDMLEESYEEIKWLRKNDLVNAKRYSGLYEKLRVRLSKLPGEL